MLNVSFFSFGAFACYFTVLWAVLLLFGFVYKEFGTVSGIDKLKRANDIIRNNKAFDLAQGFIRNIVDRAKQFHSGKSAFWYFFITMFFLNILVVPASCLLTEYMKREDLSKAWRELMGYKMYNCGIPRFLIMNLTAGLIGILLNWSSLKITLALLRKMANARKQWLVIFHLVINLLVVSAYAFLLIPISVFFNWKVADSHHMFMNWHQAYAGTFRDQSDIVIPLMYGATSSIPTVLYLLCIFLLLALKFAPKFLRKIIIDTINALTRPNRNVLNDIGTFFGTTAAICTAIEAAKFFSSH